MNRLQTLAACISAANLALALLFLPYDYVSIAQNNIPTFGGFHLVGTAAHNAQLNRNFLTVEIVVILLNAGIAWLLLRESGARPPASRSNRAQRNVLWLVAANLVLILLFPPFENYYAVTKATLPSFDGFYFLFGDNAQRQIVAVLLYLEVSLVLVNGGLFWLLFAGSSADPLAVEEKRALDEPLLKQQRGD